ncbi:hypothetical protein AMJ47_01050 [Parcubacteria bacterium DG_72]|nr:MAG: hypothetical protein AMJ47_01050 [Parcubacteria bacterium DG_72]
MKGTRAFTLIELIVYIAIVSVVLVLVTGFSFNILYGNIKAQAVRETQQNARFALEKITRSIRSGQDPSIFSVSDGILYQQGVALTTDQVRVTVLDFTSLNNSYRINIGVEYYNPDNRPEYRAFVNMESTVLSRP